MAAPAFRTAECAQQSVLAKIEKRCLIWLAERMPGWVNSDHLTALGLVGMLGAGLSYWLARYNRAGLLWVIFWLAVNWFGDSLDGTLARVRNRQRPRYGFYVDHVVDVFASFFLVAGLALSGFMSPLVAAGALIAYYMLAIEVYLATYTIGTFHLSFGGLGPTELRLLFAVGNLWLYFHPGIPQTTLFGQRYRVFDVGGIVGMAALWIMMLYSALRHTRQLYRAERLR